MKVYSNLMNNNSKINASEIAYKDGNDIELLIDIIKSLRGQILWANPNPLNDFPAQNISLNSNDYDCYEVIYYGSKTGANVFNTGKIPKGKNSFLQQCYQTGATPMIRAREIDYVSDTVFYVQQGLVNGSNNNDHVNIPVYIIGYKTGLF